MKVSNELISVILPAKNSDQTLLESIHSILNQTYKHIHLHVLDHSSTDTTKVIIEDVMKKDSRVFYHYIDESISFSDLLNYGVSVSKGSFIARMDSDDISHSNRLQKQIEYMLENNIAILGSSVNLFGEGIRPRKKYYPVTNSAIEVQLLFNSPFAHPSVTCRREVFDEFHYDFNFKHIEDYDLWQRVSLSQRYLLGNLRESLLRYRVSENQISRQFKSQLYDYKKIIGLRQSKLPRLHILAVFVDSYHSHPPMSTIKVSCPDNKIYEYFNDINKFLLSCTKDEASILKWYFLLHYCFSIRLKDASSLKIFTNAYKIIGPLTIVCLIVNALGNYGLFIISKILILFKL